MGLPSAQAQIFGVQGLQVLLVARYDRRVGVDGQPMRIHQEDFCQALGVVPEMKYQNEGGPDLKACFDLLRKATRPSAPQVLRLLDAVVFNALIGNHDAHAKNFSLLYADPGKNAAPTLAPLYDMLCTAVYDHLTPTMPTPRTSPCSMQVRVKTWHRRWRRCMTCCARPCTSISRPRWR
jgi:serine/threonine-protein kinase HipA